MENQKNQSKQIQIKADDETARGRYSNSMFIGHGPEEFIIDWLLSSPTGSQLVSRVIVTPGHLKRIISVLHDNLKKYEEKFGEVKVAKTVPGNVEHKYH